MTPTNQWKVLLYTFIFLRSNDNIYQGIPVNPKNRQRPRCVVCILETSIYKNAIFVTPNINHRILQIPPFRGLSCLEAPHYSKTLGLLCPCVGVFSGQWNVSSRQWYSVRTFHSVCWHRRKQNKVGSMHMNTQITTYKKILKVWQRLLNCIRV